MLYLHQSALLNNGLRLVSIVGPHRTSCNWCFSLKVQLLFWYIDIFNVLDCRPCERWIWKDPERGVFRQSTGLYAAWQDTAYGCEGVLYVLSNDTTWQNVLQVLLPYAAFRSTSKGDKRMKGMTEGKEVSEGLRHEINHSPSNFKGHFPLLGSYSYN
jgi:hypothetical protein